MNRFRNSLVVLVLSLFAIGGTTVMAQPAAAPQAMTAMTSKKSTVADADKLDINTATADQLKSLKGVGDAYSKRIIAGRPYVNKAQLLSRGILPQATYNGIKDQIVARAVKK